MQGKEGLELDDPAAIAAERKLEAALVRGLLDSLDGRGLVADSALTDAGHATAERLVGARRDCLSSLIADWQPDDDPRVNDAVARLARELGRDTPASVT